PQAAATRTRKPAHVIVLVGAGLAVVGAGYGVGNVERGLAAVGVPVVHARVRLAVHAELVLPHAPGVGVIGIAVAIVVSECYPGGAERIVARGPDQRRATGTRRGRPALAIEAIGDARPAGQIKIRRRPVGIGGADGCVPTAGTGRELEQVHLAGGRVWITEAQIGGVGPGVGLRQPSLDVLHRHSIHRGRIVNEELDVHARTAVPDVRHPVQRVVGITGEVAGLVRAQYFVARIARPARAAAVVVVADGAVFRVVFRKQPPQLIKAEAAVL